MNRSFMGSPKSYKVLEKLHDSENSKIFKVLCSDMQMDISAEMTLKILSSKNGVQDWTKEFESLKAVRSGNCVSVYHWEKINGSPSLVLEWIDGINLKQLVGQFVLSDDEINYIMNEIHQGLVDLKHCGLFHGDLSPNNVMIDRNGEVKLIDFGMANLCGRYTPSFVAPEVINDNFYGYFADLYSLGKIQFFLGGDRAENTDLTLLNPERRKFSPKKLKLSVRQSIAKKVINTLSRRLEIKTQIAELDKPTRKLSRRLILSLGLLFTLTSSTPHGDMASHAKAFLTIKSKKWHKIVIDGKEQGYSPLFRHPIVPGTVEIRWQGPAMEGSRSLTLVPGEHKVIDLTDH